MKDESQLDTGDDEEQSEECVWFRVETGARKGHKWGDLGT